MNKYTSMEEFDRDMGGDSIVCRKLHLRVWANGARCEDHALGMYVLPEASDPETLAKFKLLYRQEKLERAVRKLEQTRDGIISAVMNATQHHVPAAREEAINELKPLLAEVKKWKRETKKAQKELAKFDPASEPDYEDPIASLREQNSRLVRELEEMRV